jgi:imidazolonepropionase
VGSTQGAAVGRLRGLPHNRRMSSAGASTDEQDAPWDGLLLDARLATLAGDAGYGIVEDGAIAWRAGRITYAGPRAGLDPAQLARARRQASAGGDWITPALVDCHTHLVFAGNRAVEAERRLQGASYEQIAREGGGILATVNATRAASEDALHAQSLPRALALRADGVATLEIKSGYGLGLDDERKMLRVARRLGRELGIEVRCTFLGAHALPPEFDGRADAYIAAACDWLRVLHGEGLVDAVDAFCEGIGFSPAQVRRMFEAARGLGLPVKLHADQLSDLAGAALAAEFGALSADHIEYSSEASVQAMARAGVVAVLLPGAFHVLRETRLPPLASLRAHGVPMAVATDLNPGTSPLQSLRLAMSLACTHFQLTPEEALRGATCHAARALGLADRGRLLPGLRADLARWRIGHPSELCYWLGGAPLASLHVAGEELVGIA